MNAPLESALESTAILGARLRDFCVAQLDTLSRRQLPNLELPRTYGGHLVAADVRADLLYTLGHLAACGVDSIGGSSIENHIISHLGQVDGASTHTFFSYRVAETIARAGAFEGNPLLESFGAKQRDQLRLACDSNDWIALLDEQKLPRNYAAVLARCERARIALGLDVDEDRFASLVQRLQAFLASNPLRFLDDSHDQNGRYDIYTADVWLFCEPLAEHLGDLWREGMLSALRLVDRVGGPDGSAIPWGRSTGVLAIALTIELAALVISRDLELERQAAWIRRGCDAMDAMESWFGDGVINAHQYRDQDAYRGPARRLQLTFDVLGKLAVAAKELLTAETETVAAKHRDTYRIIDAFVPFETDRAAGVWAHRQPGLAFVVPFVGAARSHYFPSVHAPGRFEVPVDADLPTWTPLVHSGFARFAGGGVPSASVHEAGELTVEWNGFPATAFDYTGKIPEPLAGSRTAAYSVDGRTIQIEEHLEFVDVPAAVTVIIPDIAADHLAVEFAKDLPSTQTPVDVLGLKEWRSSWSEIAVAHQLDLAPARSMRYSIRVTPKLRVISTAYGHHYHRSLYDPLASSVVSFPNPLGPLGDASVALRDIDVFHLHWPEWIAFDDLAEHDRIIATLRDHAIPIVWTAHNLTPHEKRPEVYDVIYQRWASAARAVIHHSDFGYTKMLSRYEFDPACIHEVIPHGHFGELWAKFGPIDKASAELALGLSPSALRIGLLGAPRAEKRVLDFLKGVVRSPRTDLSVACWSLAYGEFAPVDPRIEIAEQYQGVSERQYALRLASCDVLALPFEPQGDMLATGTVADAIGMGMPVFISDWEYLTEMLGRGGIRVGLDPDSIAEALDALTGEQLDMARAEVVKRRAALDWEPLAQRTFTFMERALLSQ